MNVQPIRLPRAGRPPQRATFVSPRRANEHKTGVILVHDILGFTDDCVRNGRRLAEAGYPTIIPHMYDGVGGKAACVVKTLRDHQRGRGDSYDGLEAARRFLLAQEDAPVSQIGVMGFCMGGRFALFYAAGAPVQVVAPFYCDVPPRAEDLKGICPVVGGFGGTDRLHGKRGERLVRHLTQLGVEHDVRTYDGVGHSYMNDHGAILGALGQRTPLRAAYDRDASEDSWERLFRFFERVLDEPDE